ncbi:unnamed protein product, partial [marine sediment metagenome]
MPDLPDYHDKRADFFKAHFAKALNYQDYLATGEPVHQQRWNQHHQAIQLTSQQQELIKNFTRKLNILFMSGIWCGDCVRQGPLIQHIAQ